MATGNAYEMEMNGAQKANKTVEAAALPATMAPSDGIAYTPCGARVRLFIHFFAIIFYFCSDVAAASAAVVVVLFWQLLLLLLLLFFARLVTGAKVAACAVRKERKNCCAIASTVA